MVFRLADVEDDRIGCGSGLIDSTAEPLLDLAVAAASPRRQALRQHFRRRRDRDHHDIGIDPAHRGNHGARHIGDHGAAGADIVVDTATQRVAVTVRLPMHGVGIAAHAPDGRHRS